MKTGKITAKLRDAVLVCLMEGDKKVKQYQNIEIPDSLKELEMLDFHFNVHVDGKITFEIHYEEGVLPEIFPEPRTQKLARPKQRQQPTSPQKLTNRKNQKQQSQKNHPPENLPSWSFTTM